MANIKTTINSVVCGVISQFWCHFWVHVVIFKMQHDLGIALKAKWMKKHQTCIHKKNACKRLMKLLVLLTSQKICYEKCV